MAGQIMLQRGDAWTFLAFLEGKRRNTERKNIFLL
jgi:hypothetical protein